MVEEIPFRCLPYSAWQELTVKLEPTVMLGSDWRNLAEKLGYNAEHVGFLESRRQDKPCTLLLLGEYVKKESATVEKFKAALEEISRPDALVVLNNHMQEAEEMYKNEKNTIRPSPRTPEEVTYSWSSNCPPYVYSYPAMVNSMPYCPTTACHVHPSPPCRHNSIPEPRPHLCNGYPSQNGSIPYIMQRGVQGHPYFSGEYTPPQHNGCQESMMVHEDPAGPGEMISVDDIDMEEDNHRREDPAPLPQTIMRGDNQLSSFTHSQSMGQPTAIDVAREEEVETSGHNADYIAYNHVRERHGRPGYYGQDMVPKQPMSSSNRPYIIKGTLVNMNNHQMMHDAGLRKVSSPPISKLQQLAKIPPCYQPNQEYKKIVADQKVEDERMGRPRQFKEEKMDAPSCSGHDNQNFTDLKKMQSRTKNGVRETPKTFPRVKTPTTGTVVSNLQQLNQSNTLTKSTSMPVDMKPAEFRKAFRHIKVFVTYSNDNKTHLCHVLSLCNCMVKNGFSVCVDINSRYVSTLPNQHDKVNWYHEKFNESDFILVCPSAKYKSEIEAQEQCKNGMMPESQLHTRYIYSQMLKEYRDQAKNTRFVPVLFQSSDEQYLPSWLQRTLKYTWPSQYKDLLWMLTRPKTELNRNLSCSLNPSASQIHRHMKASTELILKPLTKC